MALVRIDRRAAAVVNRSGERRHDFLTHLPPTSPSAARRNLQLYLLSNPGRCLHSARFIHWGGRDKKKKTVLEEGGVAGEEGGGEAAVCDRPSLLSGRESD